MIAWLGIDPGPSWTGLALRSGRDLLGHRVIRNGPRVDAGKSGPKRDHGVGWDYLAEILAAVDGLSAPGTRHAIEAAICPAPFAGGKKSFIPPRDILGLGLVFGALWANWPHAIVVQPGGNGSGLLASYPDGLVSAVEKRHGLNRPAPQSSELRHARSGWDISLEAEKIARWQVAS